MENSISHINGNNLFKATAFISCIGLCYNCYSINNKKDSTKSWYNIVFIIADDLGYAQSGCYGSDYYQTPNIDRLASEGIRFTNAYAAAAVCSPTRASIMTGKYPARLHITDYIPGADPEDKPLGAPNWQKHLPFKETTIAEQLKKHGYHTALFGKWHLSAYKTPPESMPYNPDKHGFDECFVTYKPASYMPLGKWQTAGNDAHNVDTITNLGIDFMERNQDNPFFLVIAHNSIHDPLMENDSLIEKYRQLPATDKPENHPVIAAMAETLDASLGKVLDSINNLGLKGNTMVIFYSDNGGKASYAKQTPLRKGKGWLYEGGIRVPLIIRWPDVIDSGTSTDEMISSIDFYPTFLDLAGINHNLEKIDGSSLLPLLQHNKALKRDALYWNYPHYHIGSGMRPAAAIRKGNYKLIEWYEGSLLDKPGVYELYDLKHDIGETNNLTDSLPGEKDELINLLDAWKKKVDAQSPVVR